MTGHLHVVAPHATRTGSTKVLLGLLRAARPTLGLPVAIELRSGGPLAEEVRALGSGAVPDGRPGLVLVNSSLAAGALVSVEPDIPTVVYVHEAAEVLSGLAADQRAGLDRADVVLCVSTSIAADVARLGIPGRIAVLPPLVVPLEPPTPAAVSAAREAAGATAAEPLVVACGEAGWRKGADLFAPLARHLTEGTSLRFAWVGRRIRPFHQTLDHDSRLCGVADRLRWIGDVADAAPLLAAADVVVMTSRHDPQPLVPLEAAQVGTPTAAFAVGGLAELGADGVAAVVPFPDTGALAEEVRRLLADPAAGEALVAAGRRRIAARQAPEVVVPRFVAELRALLV